MILGTTFSTNHCEYIKLDYQDSFKQILDLKFDFIRIGTYWSIIESSKEDIELDSLMYMLDLCENNGQDVVLTIGMKAPRWPEFYIPKWAQDNLEQNVLDFNLKILQFIKNYTCIKYLQIENEPLDPTWPDNNFVPVNLLYKEIEQAKSFNYDVIVNFWGNELTKRNLYPLVINYTDIIGIDIYYNQNIGPNKYTGPLDSDPKLKKLITKITKPIWIMELQAEPWEVDVFYAKDIPPKSINPKLLEKNYDRAIKLGVKAIFFWGCEFWLWQKAKGDLSYLETIKNIIKDNKT